METSTVRGMQEEALARRQSNPEVALMEQEDAAASWVAYLLTETDFLIDACEFIDEALEIGSTCGVPTWEGDEYSGITFVVAEGQPRVRREAPSFDVSFDHAVSGGLITSPEMTIFGGFPNTVFAQMDISPYLGAGVPLEAFAPALEIIAELYAQDGYLITGSNQSYKGSTDDHGISSMVANLLFGIGNLVSGCKFEVEEVDQLANPERNIKMAISWR